MVRTTRTGIPNKTAKLGESEQDRQHRTARTGQPEQSNQKGQTKEDRKSWYKTARTE